ncbi:hypothetical protein BDV96DRAFT_642290 [Lophiotrema nucula]|uniref:Beta/gamma crystallin 'Greek key' domain-containing protein n=1 Tax=Lophiotrema nucula TaxID=690887 RepID=A0A6A5ZJP3_9PLEO|nr:hypothetical protein BDV96DRAFT_642290 [Lophiotrema nucula]
MKLSATFSIATLFALASASAIPAADPIEQGYEASEVEARADTVRVVYCNDKNYGNCQTRTSYSGDCVNLDSSYNNNVESVQLANNELCIFWDGSSCQGDHTGYFVSNQWKPDMKDWNNKISSYRCCSGTKWCAGGV